jgi:hypothetical protein
MFVVRICVLASSWVNKHLILTSGLVHNENFFINNMKCVYSQDTFEEFLCIKMNVLFLISQDPASGFNADSSNMLVIVSNHL